MHVSQQKRIASLKLRAKILEYLEANPGVKQVYICDKFRVTSGTASRHVNAIRQGWRPEDHQSNREQN